MVALIEVKCFIDGTWMSSERTATLSDFEGIPRVRLHGATPTQVRIAKRSMLQSREQLARTPLSLLFRILRSAVQHYFADNTDFDTVARLSGSPISYVYGSIERIKHWITNIDKYLANAFGNANYEQVPLMVGDLAAGYKKFVPTGPTIVVLPQNDDGISAYVLAQLFLSKNPVLVKPSAHGGSAFAAMRFIHALHTAIRLEAPEQPHLFKAIQLINILDEPGIDRTRQVAELGIDGANFVLFGSDASVTGLANAIVQNVAPRTILRLGTGFSASVILADANLGLALNELYDSVIEDRGNKCTTTHALYVHDAIYNQVKQELTRLAQQSHPPHPLDTRARIGHLDPETRASVAKRIAELFPRHTNEAERQGFRFFEVEEHERIEELPGPLVFVKRIRNVEHFCKLLAADRARNRMDRNLVTSVFTESHAAVETIAAELPSHIVKWNIGSHAINLFIEHQSMFIIKEMMTQTVVEYLSARKAAAEQVAEAERR